MRRIAALVLAALVTLAFGVAGGAGAAEKTPPGDPPGNNGTIKVVADDPSDPDPGNEPQIDGCLVWLEFYGFDQGQTADIAFFAQPPTGQGEQLLAHTAVISEDPAGGGQDKDATLAYNLTSALQGFEAHPQQGYHVKVTSNSQEAPGGAKEKVFWMTCAPEPAGEMQVTKTVEGGDAEGPFGFTLACNHTPLDRAFTLAAGASEVVADVPAGTVCVLTETDRKGAAGPRVKETPGDGADDGQVRVPAGGQATVEVVNLFGSAAEGAETTLEGAGEAAPDTAPATEPEPAVETLVAGETLTAPAASPGSDVLGATTTLPRTGGEPWATVAVGSWALAAGGLTLAAGGRRRRDRQR